MQQKLSLCFAVLLSGWLAPTTVTVRAGTLGGFSVEQTFDAYLRPSVLSVKNGGNTLASATSAYDAASRLQSVTGGTYSAHYSYVYKSPLVEKIEFKQNSTLRLTQQNGYDFINRLSAITNPTSVAVSRHAYVYNHANQRTSAALQDGSYWVYEYDNLGQVKVGKRYWADGTAVAGQQFEYTHDDIGNRTATKAGGDSAGASLRSATYSPTRLNQYASRTVPGAVDILGIGHALATVAVNGQSTYRTNEYYQKALSFDNSSAAVYTNVSVTASLGGSTVTNTGKLFLPTATETFAYDADGNLTNDTRWAYTWDSENRLIKMISKIGGVTPNQIDFEYDYAGRRIKKAVTNGGNVTTTKYLYRDWRVLAEVNGSNGLIRSYMWGLDLSGTPDQAGGVGGLLAVKPNGGPAHFAAYDGNGNVTALVKGDDGTVSARYEYGPFGELIRMSGPMATANSIRFSTKITDDETDLVYYGFRYFNPNTGRWLSGDPLGESGGINLYGFAANNPIGFVDLWGLRPAPPNIEAYINDYFNKHGELPWVGWWDHFSNAPAFGWHPFTDEEMERYGFSWNPNWNSLNAPAPPSEAGSESPPQFTNLTMLESELGEFIGTFENPDTGEMMTGGGTLRYMGTEIAKDAAVQVAGLGATYLVKYLAPLRWAAKTPLALPAPRQIQANWGVNTYRHGGQMSAIEHINYRHSFNSGFQNVSRFAEGTSVRNIQGYVDDTLRYGNVTPVGANGFRIEYNLGRTIGTDASGNAASNLRVFVRDGNIQTAFPY